MTDENCRLIEQSAKYTTPGGNLVINSVDSTDNGRYRLVNGALGLNDSLFCVHYLVVYKLTSIFDLSSNFYSIRTRTRARQSLESKCVYYILSNLLINFIGPVLFLGL